ncbi:serine hydrolase domain-containing protein [Caulobacter sp. 17J65-9]|uniref:serine hydrolase domain-containing protein n=1 Tax=Caulobacter sp. 17J65-9 TaxID=2709382 RepID=UPI0013CD498E|nr:serine hydrolase domain-containing protein [Caulobacter sp. 17J65-9]NEX92774.1 beta-lactamase family protein [Caulobacter sp. 17J65-9]
MSPLFDRRALLAAGASLAFAGSARAKDGSPELVEALRRRVADEKQGTGAAVGVIRAGRLEVSSYGRFSLDDPRRPGADTVFQIASLTKIFTALLLTDAVRRGEVALDDPLSKHLPGPPIAFEGREATLLDLATHTSGLPLRPASRVDRSQDDPYAGYSEADLHADLALVRLTRAPGAAFQYSNFDYGLLGDALAHRLGRSYAELLQSRILGPLGMHETTLTPTADMRRRAIPGYDLEFKPARPWELGALAPAGGLFSTLQDMAKFLRLWTGEAKTPLAQAAAAMLTTDRPGDAPDIRMAIGWRRIRPAERTLFWSNGNAGGVRSFMGFDVETRAGVIAYVNRISGLGVDDIGVHVLDPSQAIETA